MVEGTWISVLQRLGDGSENEQRRWRSAGSHLECIEYSRNTQLDNHKSPDDILIVDSQEVP